jgi:EAL domain-containing protein (putative c-di-GMP-specific phosphodiesterase class I)/PleD family two-component response regulator
MSDQKAVERSGRILCVDDETRVLEGLAAILRKRFDVVTATSGEAALEQLSHGPDIDVIISDMRMPGMSGAEFLSRSRAVAPGAQRILLTGHADVASAIAAVNEGQVFRFLTKPCPPVVLVAAVQAGVERVRTAEHERSAEWRRLESVHRRRDPQTGLASRLGATETLEQAATDSGPARAVVVWYIDIAHREGADFGTGDTWNEEVPRLIAERLRRYSPADALVARWAPQQFVILRERLVAGDLDLYLAGKELWERLSEELTTQSQPLSLDVRIGIARLSDGEGHSTLIESAAAAAAEARRTQSDAPQVCVYRPEILLQAERGRALAAELPHAVERQELLLYYQPIIDTSSGRLHAVECLARWQHPTLGLIPAGVFIPMAERSGEIVRMGKWILSRACQDLSSIVAERGLRLTVNMSVKEVLAPGFVEFVDRCLAHSGMAPEGLELELTESTLAADMDRLSATLQQLRQRRVRVAVDDFGTGYSSLAYLSRLLIDTVKVDRVFVNEFEEGGRTIIKAAVAMAQDFKQEVIVEGVETADRLMRLRDLGVTLMQGYWLARPMPFGALAQWVEASDQSSSSELIIDADLGAGVG